MLGKRASAELKNHQLKVNSELDAICDAISKNIHKWDYATYGYRHLVFVTKMGEKEALDRLFLIDSRPDDTEQPVSDVTHSDSVLAEINFWHKGLQEGPYKEGSAKSLALINTVIGTG